MELTAAIGADWADVLEGIPQQFIQRACIEYQRQEPRKKPTPGAVYQIARSLMPKPERVVNPYKYQKPENPRVTQEQAEKILKQAGVKLNRFGGVEKL